MFDMVRTAFSYIRWLIVCQFLELSSKVKESSLHEIWNADTAFLLGGAESKHWKLFSLAAQVRSTVVLNIPQHRVWLVQEGSERKHWNIKILWNDANKGQLGPRDQGQYKLSKSRNSLLCQSQLWHNLTVDLCDITLHVCHYQYNRVTEQARLCVAKGLRWLFCKFNVWYSWDKGRFMKNFRFNTFCNITYEPQELFKCACRFIGKFAAIQYRQWLSKVMSINVDAFRSVSNSFMLYVLEWPLMTPQKFLTATVT